jgi:hypothetical protein
MYSNEIKIVRTLWGPFENTKPEVTGKEKFSNEVVMVWGKQSEDYLKSLGYETILMHENQEEPGWEHPNKKFNHKIKAIKLADSLFGEYLLLDWDTFVEKPLDDNFTNLLRQKSDIQCTLYCIPEEFYDILFNTYHGIDEKMTSFFENQHRLIKEYSWKFKNSYVFPNFSFFYSNNAKIGEKLETIIISNDIITNVEEFALFKYVECDLDEYIKKYEPLVSVGQREDALDEVQLSLDNLNTYIKESLNKNLYFYH